MTEEKMKDFIKEVYESAMNAPSSADPVHSLINLHERKKVIKGDIQFPDANTTLYYVVKMKRSQEKWSNVSLNVSRYKSDFKKKK